MSTVSRNATALSNADFWSSLTHKRLEIRKPLTLLDGSAYLATWIEAPKMGTTDKSNKEALVIVRDDGKAFSDIPIPDSNLLKDLGIHIDLPVSVRRQKRLSPNGLHRIFKKEKPDPKQIYSDLVKAIRYFVSFNKAFPYAEFLALWIMGTYCLDAFSVTGYIWPTGEAGCGKTQLLQTVSRLAYLGKTVTSSSTFASIRDEANYGAALAFDDCENTKFMDSSKRELLLAGNTRGAFVSIKEPRADGSWAVKDIDSFAPRMFSSISIPDPVLASRTILVNLVKSGDKEVSRRSPMRDEDWPFDLSEMIDSLWINALLSLPKLKAFDQEASAKSQLLARQHDIFRIPLALAFWLEKEYGATNLFEEIDKFASEYFASIQEDVGSDEVSNILRVIAGILIERGGPQLVVIPVGEIVKRVHRYLIEIDQTEMTQQITPTRMGLLLKRLGFEKSASHGTNRTWKIRQSTLNEALKLNNVTIEPTEANVTMSSFVPF